MTNRKGEVFELLVDAEDWPLVSQYRWSIVKPSARNRTYYAMTHVGRPRRSVSLHRLVAGEPDGLEVDHKNGNGLDCRRANLREATGSQNSANVGVSSANTSGFKGVSQRPNGRWWARIHQNKKMRSLGVYATPEEAHEAYKRGAKELYGEFAKW